MERLLGGTERGLWRVDQAGPLNFVAVAAYRGSLETAALRRGLAVLQARHPLLRVRIVDTPAGLCWTGADVPAIPLREEARRDDRHWHAELAAELNRPLPWAEGPLVRVVHLRGAAGGDLLAAFHHAVADGLSGVNFLRQLLAAAADAGPEVAGPAVLRPPLEEQLPAAARGAAGLLRAGAMALRQVPDLLAGIRRLPVTAWAPPRSRQTGVIPLVLAAPEAAALAARCRAEGTSVHAALAAAFLQAVHAALAPAEPWPVRGRLGVVSPVSLRARLEPPAGAAEFGFFVSAVTVLESPAEIGGAFWPLARAVKGRLAAALERDEPALAVRLQNLALRGGGTPEQLALRAEQLFPAAVGLTNLGRLGDTVETFGAATLEQLHFSAALNALAGSGLGVAAATYAGVLRLNVAHAEPLLPAARARALAEDALARLRAALA